MAVCPTTDELQGLVTGRLSDWRAGQLFAHVDRCPACQSRVADVQPEEEWAECVSVEDDPFEGELECVGAVSRVRLLDRWLWEAPPTRTDLRDLRELGPYSIERQLGRGGMATVFRATRRDGEAVALKVVSVEGSRREEAIQRFTNEANAMRRSDHPHVVRLTDFGEIDGFHFLAMEFIDGCDLSSLLRRMGALSTADACELARQAATALCEFERCGFVHRDIKPANLILARCADGHNPSSACLKIVDLGMVLGAATTELTATDHFIGTLDYVAPEQANDSHRVDIRADIYGLGATLYKLLTGRAPFETGERRGRLDRLYQLAFDDPVSLDDLRPDIPGPLRELVHRMIDRDPDRRPQRPADVAARLAEFADGADLGALCDRATGYADAR